MAGSPTVTIPEITKAYQNDPQTQLALAAIKSGTSTAPVATRGYGYADGAARVIQSIVGALQNKATQQGYATDQAAQLAARNQDGGANLAALGMGSPATPPSVNLDPSSQSMPSIGGSAPLDTSTPDATSAIAAALGGQTASPAQGGGPAGQVPFGPDPSQSAAPAPQPPPQAAPAPSPQVAAVANALAGPQAPAATPVAPLTVTASPVAPPTSRFGVHEAIPDAPTVLGRPDAPQAITSGPSPLLVGAYRNQQRADKYESNQDVQDRIDAGLADQSKLNSDSDKRKQALIDMGYNTDLQRYSESTDEANKSAYAQRTAAQTRNFERDQTLATQAFTGSQDAQNRAKDLQVANIDTGGKIAAAKIAAGIGADGTSSAVLQQSDLDRMAAQYIAGDKSVMSTVAGGRSAIAAINKANLNRTITAKLTGAGQTGADMASNIARYIGETRAAAATGQRVGAATVSTSELPLLAKMSSNAYTQLPRGQFVPFNKLQQMYDTNAFSSPAQAKAYAADSAVVGAYARALSPIGAPHDSDKKRAVQMLNTAQSPAAHQAVLDQLNAETQAIRQGAQEALSGGSTTPTSKSPFKASNGYIVQEH